MTGTNIGDLKLNPKSLAKIEKSFSSSTKSRGEVMSLLQKVSFQLSPRQIKNGLCLSSLDYSKGVFSCNKNNNIECFSLDEAYTNSESDSDSKELLTQGVSTPQWSSLADLPGLQVEKINSLGFKIFKNFGLKENNTPLVISSFADADMLNTPLELNSVLGFLESNAAKLSPENMKISFEGVIKDYIVDACLYLTNDKAYLAIFEDDNNGVSGRYIYMFDRDVKAIEN